MAAGNGGGDRMTRARTVIHSINAPGGLVCVDVFRHPDGRFGWAQYRRDPEDGRGWFAISRDTVTYDDDQAALTAARAAVAWLSER